MENILLKIWEEENGDSYKVIGNQLLNVRDLCAKTLAWGIPNKEALEELAKYQPILEVGAGLGYWAKLLQDRNVEILPTDRDAPTLAHTKVTQVDTLHSIENRNYTLFMCWVPEEAAIEVSRAYEGNTIIWVGEQIKFPNFQLEKEITLPQWKGYEDSMQVFRRI
jgi:hypothetical protein